MVESQSPSASCGMTQQNTNSNLVTRCFTPEVPPAPLVPSFADYFRLRPFVFAAWFHARRRWLSFKARFSPNSTKIQEMRFDDATGKAHLVDMVIPYNSSLIWRISRHRTERLINILRCIGTLNIRESSLLCIGPRNEAEVLLFSLYGFPLEKITAIDLFTYSPLIKLMDMHDMQLPDNSFDVVYSSYVIRYSDNVEKALEEMGRVVKDGGLIACGFVYKVDDRATGRLVGKGLQGLYDFYGDQVSEILWREEYPIDRQEIIATTIFRVRKTGSRPQA